mgnify:CR=1 FL=1
MTIREVLQRHLSEIDADGLCNSGCECGCPLDQLAPLGDCLDLDECLPGRGQKCKILIREAGRGPFDRRWKALPCLAAKEWVRVDANSLAVQISNCPFRWTAAAFSLDIAMIRGEVDSKPSCNKQTEKIAQVSLPSPLAHLVVHSGSSHLHPMRYLVHLIYNKPGNPCPRV